MAIKVGGVTVIDDGKNISNIAGGAITGIQSGGAAIGAGATTLNFTGSGNQLTYNSGTNTIDITIAGSGGGGGGGQACGSADASVRPRAGPRPRHGRGAAPPLRARTGRGGRAAPR